MKYDSESGVIRITLGEFVSIARRATASVLPFDEEEPTLTEAGAAARLRLLGVREAEKILFGFSLGKHSCELIAYVDRIDGDDLSFLRETDALTAAEVKNASAEARGEAYVAAYAYLSLTGKTSARLSISYLHTDSGEISSASETVNFDKLEKFFFRCCASLTLYAEPEIDRVTNRLPSLSDLRFPFPKIRDGQSEMIRSVYRTVAHGGTLYCAAPTGTGKTAASLYPALRALGDRKCDKIFYLTPKSTTASVAAECIDRFSQAGAKIRAVILSAKERICEIGTVCRVSKRNCTFLSGQKMPDAVMALFHSDKAVVTYAEIRETARKYRVCPYELSLSYAEIADVVICDINYLFDPRVMIRRFFTEGGNFAFLVDEAHNLPDRAREMYSAELTEAEILLPASDNELDKNDPLRAEAKAAREGIFSSVFPLLKEEIRETESGKAGACHLSEVPTKLYTVFEKLIAVAERSLKTAYAAKDEEALTRVAFLRTYVYSVEKFYRALTRFSDGYELFLFYEDGTFRMKVFCLDPGKTVAAAIAKGKSAVFFSATLSPLDYYKSVLGGNAHSETSEVGSPFAPEQLEVAIMDKISTRFSEREDTLPAILRVIAATVSAKRGNYIIFSPSFAYSDALAKAFRAKYPKIRSIVQKKNMSVREKEEFLAGFSHEDGDYLIAFCVMGGIYAEGIDLAGDKLIGAVIVGIGMPSLSYEREAMSAYYDEKFEAGKAYAYVYPGLSRVLQAAGRVIRKEEDRGVIVLIDDRFDDPLYRGALPPLWREAKFLPDAKDLRLLLDRFWAECEKEKTSSAPTEEKK